MLLNEKIKARLLAMSAGCVATLWDLLVYRVNESKWIIGHNSLKMSDPLLSIDDAVAKFERMLD